eukprot:1161191-Pelagomonas_calceolata.AAC.4
MARLRRFNRERCGHHTRAPTAVFSSAGGCFCSACMHWERKKGKKILHQSKGRVLYGKVPLLAS